MSRFASEFFAQSPALLYPMLALLLFFVVFLAVVIHVFRMKPSEVERLARIPLEDDVVEDPNE
jgi:cbb3-type cytochrome oxidase subunit 3